jgi:hypothetical protein
MFAALAFWTGPACARTAAVAGQFYPADKGELAAFADAALAAESPVKVSGPVVAVLAPHAGYEFSGKMAGLAYKDIADSYDTVVILGTAHTEAVKGAALLAGDYYETPLGKVPPDRELAAALLKASPLFEDRPSAHAREHSVEVQLPFLQRRLKKPFKLLAAVLNTNDLDALKKIGTALASALKGKKALLVISTDLSHYPPHRTAAAADGALLLAVKSMDPELFWRASKILREKKEPGLETCACGEAAVEAGMEAARLLGASSFVPLKLSDSYVENPAASGAGRVVGYLSGAFVRGGQPEEFKLSKGQKTALLAEARRTLADALGGRRADAALSGDPALNLPGAVFVTLTEGGALRGCVGTVEPVMTLLDAARYAAFSAAFRDGRFPPLKPEELDKVRIEVSALSALKPVKAGGIKPGKMGVVVERGGRSGLFLPQVWEQLPGKEEFLGELCGQKAGLPRDCWKDTGTKLYSFTVDAFSEEKNGK